MGSGKGGALGSQGGVGVSAAAVAEKEFAFRSEDGRYFDVIADSAEACEAWLEAMPAPPSYSMSGWLLERYSAKASTLVSK